MVCHQGSGIRHPIDRFELGNALDDSEQPNVVASDVGICFRDGIDFPHGRELVQDQKALIL